MNKFREIMIPGDILDDESLSDGARIIYGKIARLSYKDGYCWANNEFLSGVKSKRTASRFIAELQAAGYIKILTGKSKKRKIVLCEIISKTTIIDNSGYDNKNNIDKNGDDKAPIIDKLDTDHRQICPQIIDKFGDRTTNRTIKEHNVGSNEPPDKKLKDKPSPPLTESQKQALELSELILTAHRKEFPSFLSGKAEKDIRKKIEGWAVDIEYLIRLDKKAPETIRQVILWVKTPGNFWFHNIESGSKLREKFERLYGEMTTKEKRNNPPKDDGMKDLRDVVI